MQCHIWEVQCRHLRTRPLAPGGKGLVTQKSIQPIAAKLGFLVYRLHQALREAFEEHLVALGITPADWGVLAHCWEGINTAAGLADCLGVNRAAVTRVLDRVESAGLLTRTPNEAEGRSVLLTLTEAGKQTAEQAAAIAERVNSDYTAGLTEPERGQLMDLLRKTIRTMPGKKRSTDECPDG